MALLAVPVLLVAGVLVGIASGEFGGQRVAATGRLDPGFTGLVRSPTATPEATPEATPTSPPAPAPVEPPIAPAGYQVHHDAAGYWVAVPSGWDTRSPPTGGRAWWGDVSRPDVKLLFVTIKVAATKPRTASAALGSHEKAQKHGPTIFYHRIRLAARPPLPGAASVAELEFTDRDYAEGAQTWHYHTLVRAVVTPDNKLYTIEFRILHNIYRDDGTTEGDWRLAVPTVRKILASFRLG